MYPDTETDASVQDQKEKVRAHLVTAREAAMLVANLLNQKGAERGGKPVTRCRLSETTIRRLFRRKLISPEFLVEVQNWLFQAGWVLFFAGDSYALVKVKVVNGWGRIGSKRIAADLDDVARGIFKFEAFENLLFGDDDVETDDGD